MGEVIVASKGFVVGFFIFVFIFVVLVDDHGTA